MAATTQVTVTKNWQKISDGNCTVQSIVNPYLYQVAIGAASETNYIQLSLGEPVTFAFDSPVFCRLPQSHNRDSEKLTVIK
jgi:hypothetical protein